MTQTPLARQEVSILTGNHSSMIGIEDHIEILREILNLDEKQAPLSEALIPEKINFVIEEMSNPEFRQYLADFKSAYPDAILILVLTEFPTKMGGTLGYNQFTAINLTFLRLRIWAVRLARTFKHRIILKVINFPRGRLRALLKIIYRRFLSGTIVKKVVSSGVSSGGRERRLLGGIDYINYMRDRAAGTVLVKSYFDLIIALHPAIVSRARDYMKMNVDCVYPIAPETGPEIVRKRKVLPLGLFVTGSMTEYRQQIIEKFSLSAVAEGNTYEIHTRGFMEDPDEYSLGFASINIPQSPHWAYSSPVRIYRSLKYGLLPMVTTMFNDHIIERIAADAAPGTEQNLVARIDNKLVSLDEDIRSYNQEARGVNELFLAKLEKLAGHRKNSTKTF